jgi:hypothetical protein
VRDSVGMEKYPDFHAVIALMSPVLALAATVLVRFTAKPARFGLIQVRSPLAKFMRIGWQIAFWLGFFNLVISLLVLAGFMHTSAPWRLILLVAAVLQLWLAIIGTNLGLVLIRTDAQDATAPEPPVDMSKSPSPPESPKNPSG